MIKEKKIEYETDLFLQDHPQGLFIKASEQGLIEIVNELIRRWYDPSTLNNKAIILASYYGYLSVVERLLQDKRVDPSDLDNEAIGLASQNFRRELYGNISR